MADWHTPEPDRPKTNNPVAPVVVSVVVPAYNAVAYLAECLSSIVGQTHPPTEVIVVDDGSTDDTAGIAEVFGPPVRVITTANRGSASARNTGVSAAQGNVVAFCDADDVWLPHKLAAQLADVGDPTKAVAVFCGATEFVSPEIGRGAYVGRPPVEVIPRARFASTLLATTAALQVAGFFDAAAGQADWLPWCVALSDTVSDIRFTDTIGTRRRLHLANRSLHTDHDRSTWLQALRHHVAQRPDHPDTIKPGDSRPDGSQPDGSRSGR